MTQYIVSKQEKIEPLVIMGWCGTFCSLAGAVLIATSLSFLWGYTLFLTGALFWLWVAGKTRNYSLFVLHVGFALIDLIGLLNLGMGLL